MDFYQRCAIEFVAAVVAGKAVREAPWVQRSLVVASAVDFAFVVVAAQQSSSPQEPLA